MTRLLIICNIKDTLIEIEKLKIFIIMEIQCIDYAHISIIIIIIIIIFNILQVYIIFCIYLYIYIFWFQ
jgi:hypothetical protein